MAGVSTIPCPREIGAKLEEAADPSEPSLDLATLEFYHAHWAYPKSLDYWEGFVYADLCQQLGWGHLRHQEYEEALAAWRECPWPTAVEGERQALAQLLQKAYESQKLILGPPVADLLSHGRVALGTVLATLDDPAATLRQASSGVGYVVESRIVQPGGLSYLRFEFDIDTLFYLSILPAEVHSKVLLARSNYQMGEAEEAAKWLLRGAFVANTAGLVQEAFSFLEKAQQLDPGNEAVKKSLAALQSKGCGASLFSRVLVERSLFQPDPVMRCEVRPQQLPQAESPWLEVNWLAKLSPSQFQAEVEGKIASLGSMPTEQAREMVMRLSDTIDAWPLLLPASWKLPKTLDEKDVERRLSAIRGMGLEKLGLWKSNYREVLSDMLEAWPTPEELVAEPEVIDFALPKEAQVCLFSCSEPWLIPALLGLELPELGEVEVLSAWLRRLGREWEARPLMVADDVIWFQLDQLPEGHRRELFLADLMGLSSDVGECFEPTMIRPLSPGGPYLFPLPLQLQFKSDQ